MLQRRSFLALVAGGIAVAATQAAQAAPASTTLPRMEPAGTAPVTAPNAPQEMQYWYWRRRRRWGWRRPYWRRRWRRRYYW
jgi:hypothetical protein